MTHWNSGTEYLGIQNLRIIGKMDLLVKDFGVLETHMFSSRDNSFAGGPRYFAPFGRFVEVGERELVDYGRFKSLSLKDAMEARTRRLHRCDPRFVP